MSWYALCQILQVFFWRIRWVSWAHSRWRLQRVWKGCQETNKHSENAASSRYIKLGHVISINWLMQQSILITAGMTGTSCDQAPEKTFNWQKLWHGTIHCLELNKKSMDQLPTYHPLLQVQIQSEHSGVIGSTKSATAWHMCVVEIGKIKLLRCESKCYTQPLPTIEKSALQIWW